MSYEELRAHLRGRIGDPPEDEVERVLDATLAALGAALLPDDRRSVLSALPKDIAARMARPRGTGPTSREELAAEVAEATDLPCGRASEEAAIVCEALAAELEGEAVDRLARHLPEELAALLVRPPERRALPPRRARTARRTLSEAGPRDDTLASGRPNDRRSLASSGPRDDTLASGRSGSRRPLGSARPKR